MIKQHIFFLCRFLSENCICAYLCMVGQPYRCSSVSFIKLTAFFLLRKITFIISISNTYWPRVSFWHIPAPHNHSCLHLSVPHDLLTPFFIYCFSTLVGRGSKSALENKAPTTNKAEANLLIQDVLFICRCAHIYGK